MSAEGDAPNETPAITDPRSPWGAPFAQPAPPEPRTLTDPSQTAHLMRAMGDKAAAEHAQGRLEAQRRREVLTLQQEQLSLDVQREEMRRLQWARLDQRQRQEALYLDSMRRSLALKVAVSDLRWCAAGFVGTATVLGVLFGKKKTKETRT